jgi:hypothetical protein
MTKIVTVINPSNIVPLRQKKRTSDHPTVTKICPSKRIKRHDDRRLANPFLSTAEADANARKTTKKEAPQLCRRTDAKLCPAKRNEAVQE